jgi:acylphosphatase
MKEVVRYRMNYTGRVQGVGFRYKANMIANHYSLTGFVKNEYDGSVTVEVQGSEQEIYMFMKNIAQDHWIVIDNLNKEKIPVEEDERSFIITY